MMATTLEDDGVCEASESAIIQLIVSSAMVQTFAPMVAKEMKRMKRVVKFVAVLALKEVREALKQFV